MRGGPLLQSSCLRVWALLFGLFGVSCTTVVEENVGGAGGVASSSSGVVMGCGDPTPVGLPATACTPTDVSCGVNSSACLATAHAHGAPNFGLRIAHLGVTAPEAFRKGIVGGVFQSSTTVNLPLCNIQGAGTFNWLLRFDTNAGTLTVGAAPPVAHPADGYTFINQSLQLDGHTFPIAPATVPATLDPSCGLSSGPADVFLPFFNGSPASSFTIFPVRSFRIFDTRLSSDHDCIGSFNVAGLEPEDGCLPTPPQTTFLDGGNFEAFMALEDADTILVPQLNVSLCVVLGGDGDGGQPQRCKRSNGLIVFQGDWCTATNQPASAGCADAVRFAGSFAASGVKIH